MYLTDLRDYVEVLKHVKYSSIKLKGEDDDQCQHVTEVNWFSKDSGQHFVPCQLRYSKAGCKQVFAITASYPSKVIVVCQTESGYNQSCQGVKYHLGSTTSMINKGVRLELVNCRMCVYEYHIFLSGTIGCA